MMQHLVIHVSPKLFTIALVFIINECGIKVFGFSINSFVPFLVKQKHFSHQILLNGLSGTFLFKWSL